MNNLIAIQPKIEVTLSEIQILEQLGKGQFGVVSKILYKGKVYAMKQILKQTLVRHNKINSAILELKIMYSLQHENIMQLYTHFEDENNINLILEYIDGANLYDILQRDTRLQEIYAIHYFKQIVSTLLYLHSRPTPILHRDIKPENILITKTNQIKLADFGSANSLTQDELRFTFEGTPLFMAPEIYLNKGYTQKVDIWSLGVLLYEILAGNSPFLSPQEATLSALERQNVLKENILSLNIRFPDTFPPLARDLVRKLLTLEPKDRLPLEEMLKHPWFMTSTDEIDQLPIADKKPMEEWIQLKINSFQGQRKNIDSHLQTINQLKKSINETQIQIMKGEIEKQQLASKLKELSEVNDEGDDSPSLVSPEKMVKIEEKFNKLKREINSLQREVIENETFISKNQAQLSKLTDYKSKINRQKELIEKLERELISLDQQKKHEQLNQDKELQEFTKLNNSRNIEQQQLNGNTQYSQALRETIEKFKEFINLYRNVRQEPEQEVEETEQQEWRKEYVAIKKSLQEELKQEVNLLKKLELDNQQLKIRLGQIHAQEQQVQKAEQIVSNLEYGKKMKKERIEELMKQKEEYCKKIENCRNFIQYSKSP